MNQYLGRKPTYLEHFALWLNRKRLFNRKASVVAYGVAIAMGSVEPGMEFFRACTDGEGQALLMKAQFDAARQSK